MKVTQEDIDKSERRSAQRCVIATALKRVGLKEVSVVCEHSCICIWTIDAHYHIEDEGVLNLINRWDDGEKIEPFDFDLPPPGKYAS